MVNSFFFFFYKIYSSKEIKFHSPPLALGTFLSLLCETGKYHHLASSMLCSYLMSDACCTL